MTRDNIVYLDIPVDYPRRARPIPVEHLPRIFGDDRFDQLGNREWHRQVERRQKWQRVVRSFCLAVAVFAVVYFGGRELLAVWS